MIIIPGHCGSAQLLPQETIPCWTAVSPLPENNGPPESPWHASMPPNGEQENKFYWKSRLAERFLFQKVPSVVFPAHSMDG